MTTSLSTSKKRSEAGTNKSSQADTSTRGTHISRCYTPDAKELLTHLFENGIECIKNDDIDRAESVGVFVQHLRELVAYIEGRQAESIDFCAVTSNAPLCDKLQTMPEGFDLEWDEVLEHCEHLQCSEYRDNLALIMGDEE